MRPGMNLREMNISSRAVIPVALAIPLNPQETLRTHPRLVGALDETLDESGEALAPRSPRTEDARRSPLPPGRTDEAELDHEFWL